MNITKRIGTNLKQIRVARQLSLDRMAQKTGVSKAMLGQIERGETNPTVSTLWKIANGLRISFSSLIKESEPSVQIVKTEELTPIQEQNGAYQVFPLFPFHADKGFECFIIRLAPGCVHASDPHHDGVTEYITVMEGALNLSVGSQTYQVSEGQAISFTANVVHTYKNTHDTQATKLHLMISYPD